MVLTPVQERLGAIEAIQIEERRWIAAALLQGRVGLKEDVLVVQNAEDEWARSFWAAQKDDPSFRRLLEVSRLRPDRFGFDLEQRPDVEAWSKARGRDPALAARIADEIHLASEKYGLAAARAALETARDRSGSVNYTAKLNEAADAYRERIFKTMRFEDAAALRKSPGKFAVSYRGEIRQRPGETKQQFRRRVHIAQQNDRRGPGHGG